MEELKQAFYDVMHKYQKRFGEAGVMANLNTWAQRKARLLELLRRHPNWVEAEKAIVFRFSEGRDIERDVVDEIGFTMLDIAREAVAPEGYPCLPAEGAACSMYVGSSAEPYAPGQRLRI